MDYFNPSIPVIVRILYFVFVVVISIGIWTAIFRGLAPYCPNFKAFFVKNKKWAQIYLYSFLQFWKSSSKRKKILYIASVAYLLPHVILFSLSFLLWGTDVYVWGEIVLPLMLCFIAILSIFLLDYCFATKDRHTLGIVFLVSLAFLLMGLFMYEPYQPWLESIASSLNPPPDFTISPPGIFQPQSNYQTGQKDSLSTPNYILPKPSSAPVEQIQEQKQTEVRQEYSEPFIIESPIQVEKPPELKKIEPKKTIANEEKKVTEKDYKFVLAASEQAEKRKNLFYQKRLTEINDWYTSERKKAEDGFWMKKIIGSQYEDKKKELLVEKSRKENALKTEAEEFYKKEIDRLYNEYVGRKKTLETQNQRLDQWLDKQTTKH